MFRLIEIALALIAALMGIGAGIDNPQGVEVHKTIIAENGGPISTEDYPIEEISAVGPMLPAPIVPCGSDTDCIEVNPHIDPDPEMCDDHTVTIGIETYALPGPVTFDLGAGPCADYVARKIGMGS